MCWMLGLKTLRFHEKGAIAGFLILVLRGLRARVILMIGSGSKEDNTMSYQFAGIDHVQLACPRGSEEQARQFYQGVLGMQEIAKPESLRARGGVWFQCGRHQVHLGVQDDFIAALKAHPAFEVSPIDAFRKHLLQLGVKVKEDEVL
jgi:hypothetical protein